MKILIVTSRIQVKDDLEAKLYLKNIGLPHKFREQVLKGISKIVFQIKSKLDFTNRTLEVTAEIEEPEDNSIPLKLPVIPIEPL